MVTKLIRGVRKFTKFPDTRGLYARVKSSDFVRNFLILFSGTALAQIIMFVSAPILSRLYSPEDFGGFAIFVSFVGFLSVISTFKYELSIVLPKKDEDAINLLALTIGLVLFSSIISAFVAWIAPSLLDLELSKVDPLLLIIAAPLSVFLGGVAPALKFWAMRHTMFARVSVSEVLQATAMMATQVIFGAVGLGVTGLIIGRLVGKVVGAVIIAVHVFRSQVRHLLSKISIGEVFRLGKVHIDFPKYSLPRATINAMANNFVVIVIALLFGAKIAGLYWFAYRIMNLPITLISKSVRRVFYQKAAKAYNDKGPLLGIFGKTTLSLAVISIFPASVILLFGPEIFDFVFGANWERAGIYSQWLIIGWFGTFIIGPSTMLVPILGLQREVLILDIVKVILQFGVIMVAAGLTTEILAIAAYSIVTLAANLVLIRLVLLRTRRYEESLAMEKRARTMIQEGIIE